MALSTYDELITSIISWSHRKDIDTLIPDFITLSENEMFSNPDEILMVRESEKTSTATAVGTSPNESRFLALPTGFITSRDFKITVSNGVGDLRYQSPSSMNVRSGTGVPCFFTVTDEIELDVVPDQDYTVTMKYFAEFTALSTTNQTNEILTAEPNIYLFGALKQLFIWSEDIDEATKYDGLFTDAIKGANKKSKAGRYGPAPTMKFKGSVA
jgi:hypothetical protein